MTHRQPPPPVQRNRHRMNMATRVVESQRTQAFTDPVVEAQNHVRQHLADEAGTLFSQRKNNQVAIRQRAENLLAEIPLTETERTEALEGLQQDWFGFGRLDDLMNQKKVTEILVDSWDAVDVEIEGRLVRTNVRWRSHEELFEYIKRLIQDTNRPLDEGHPIVDVEVQGARINATCPPISKSCTLNIRKSTAQTHHYTPQEYVVSGSCDAKTMHLLLCCVRGTATTLICGPMGTGKTTLARIGIEGGAPRETRWIIAEDVRETEADVPRFVSLQTRLTPKNAVTMDDLFTATKRKRPDRVAIGEVRSGNEALPMLLSVTMGHPGAITTTHAGTPHDAFFNFVFYLKMANVPVAESFLLAMLHRSLDLLVFVRRFRDGHRRITRIVEVVPLGTPDFPDGFRDLIRWDYASDTWSWVHPLSDDLADRLRMEGVRVPTPEDVITLEDLAPARLDVAVERGPAAGEVS